MALSEHLIVRILAPAVVSSQFLAQIFKTIFAVLLSLALMRTLAPLRLIVGRELEMLSVNRKGGHPLAFLVYDRLECGHRVTQFDWTFLDLAHAYTECASVRARRHRCHDCQIIAQAKKPVGSVGLADVAVSA